MIASVFVDTNVLIYARDRRDPAKRARAGHWLGALGAAAAGRVNLQLIQEFTRWILANEKHRPLPDLREEVGLLWSWGSNAISPQEVNIAWTIREAKGYQWFGCLLLAAAMQLGRRYFLSEDMAAGSKLREMTLVDPFKATPSDLLPAH